MIENCFIYRHTMSEKVLHHTKTHHSTHLVSDLLFWKESWRMLYNANFEHSRAIAMFLNRISEKIEQLGPQDGIVKAERLLVRDLDHLQASLRQQKDRLQRDACEYYEIEKRFKTYEDDPDLRLSRLYHALTQARTKLEAQTGLVTKSKQDYQKAMWHLEKGCIEDMLAVETNVEETSKQIEHLHQRADTQLDKYNKQLDKWHDKLQNLRQLSADYERSFVAREKARASVVLNSLQDSVELTSNGNYTRKECLFDDIDSESIVRSKMIHTTTIDIPMFEIYKEESGKDKMYARARARVQGDNARSTERVGDGNRDYNDYDAGESERLKVNKKLRKVKLLFLVIKEHQRQEVNQLTLRLGDYVRQILPPNDDGYAYGEVVHGKIRRKKKKGFYPQCHVTFVEADELDARFLEEVTGYSDDESWLKTTRETKTKPQPQPKGPTESKRFWSSNRAASYVQVDHNEEEVKEKSTRSKLFAAIANSSFVQKLKATVGKNIEALEIAKDAATDNQLVSDVSNHAPDADNKSPRRRRSRKVQRNAWSADIENLVEDGIPHCEVEVTRPRRRHRMREATEGPINAWLDPNQNGVGGVESVEQQAAAMKNDARERRRASKMATRLNEDKRGSSSDCGEDELSERRKRREKRKRRVTKGEA